MSYNAWKNGKYLPLEALSVSILDFGLIHCDATYDVLAIHDGWSPGFDQHIERFRDSCEYWRLPFTLSDDELLEIIRTVYQENDTSSAFIWLGVTRGIPDSGRPRDLTACHSNVFVYAKPYYGFNTENRASVWVSDKVTRVSDRSINQVAKNFAWNDLTRAQFDAVEMGCDTAVLFSDEGFLTEGPGFNSAIVADGEVLAPKTNRLSGITMGIVEQLCHDHGIPFRWANIDEPAMKSADEMFLTSTAGNIIPVTKLLMPGFEKPFTMNRVVDSLAEKFDLAILDDQYSRKIHPL
jgi:branched-chain amino acid aminotransferase